MSDMVEVIRCKDCKRWESPNYPHSIDGYCHFGNSFHGAYKTYANDFCSMATRRDSQ